MMIVTWQKEEEARESQECYVFDKVNGLRVALCFGGCRVLGCIIVVVFMVCEYGSRLTCAYISPLFTSEAGNITPQFPSASAQQHDTSSSY
eukprot:scaffold17325_cov109-Skeletonema_dohrnii-CCMP3373.AAC.8